MKNFNGVAHAKRYYGLDCKVLAKTNDMNHLAWLKNRTLGITGTDLGGLTGVSKYSSPIKVYLDKVGELAPVEDNEVMYWGRTMEDVIAKEFAIRNSTYKVQKANAILQHIENEWALGNIDRLITNEKGEKGILEIKTVSEYIGSAWDGDEVPPQYMVQLQWYLYITNAKFGYFAALIGGNKYIQKFVERDDELIEMLENIAKDFWFNHVLKKIPPSVDGSEASTELLKNLYPESKEDSAIELPEESEELIEKRNRLKDEIKDLEEELKDCENKLKDQLKDNEVGLIGDIKVIWKTQIRNSIDSKKLKADKPDIFEAYCKTSHFRKFDIKKAN